MEEFKPALLFLTRFVGFYFLANLLYGLYINSYNNEPDPVTVRVTNQSAYLLGLTNPEIFTVTSEEKPSIAIYNHEGRVINVFEGCNGINVMIVFVSFLIAFKGKLKMTILFALFGLVTIYLANLIRVMLLYHTALSWENYFYYLHKYVYTGLLYTLVMLLWIIWVKKVNRAHDRR